MAKLSSDCDIEASDGTKLKHGERLHAKDIEAKDMELRTSNLSSDADIETKDGAKLQPGEGHRFELMGYGNRFLKGRGERRRSFAGNRVCVGTKIPNPSL